MSIHPPIHATASTTIATQKPVFSQSTANTSSESTISHPLTVVNSQMIAWLRVRFACCVSPSNSFFGLFGQLVAYCPFSVAGGLAIVDRSHISPILVLQIISHMQSF